MNDKLKNILATLFWIFLTTVCPQMGLDEIGELHKSTKIGIEWFEGR